MSIYNKFASVYDKMDADYHSEVMVDYSRKIFKKFKIKPLSGLDLCCGTGTALKHFTELGIEMSGLDQSAEMLAVAAKKLKGRKVKLYQKSLPNFTLYDTSNNNRVKQFDIITSFYDSLNYLKNEKELIKTFESVYKHLNEDGWFIFDMNTPLALKTLWDENTNAGVKDDMAWIWRNEYNPKKKNAVCHATFFKKKGELWERFDETHFEQGYSNSVIQKALKKSGFEVKGFYKCYTFKKADKESYRICAVAYKQLER